MKILIPLGTRPEFIKLAPVIAALRARPNFEVRVLATGQHYDDALAGVFFRELGLTADVTWELPHQEAARVGRMMTLAYEELASCRPDLVLLLGDTYTVPLFCLAARRHRVPVVHMEAGLRSFNETSMEEVNRKVAGATASLHLAPTELSAELLLREGVPGERIRVVGNPVIDVLRALDIRAKPAECRRGVVITVHRATNVDIPERLELVVRCVELLANRLSPIVFPIHPRTRSRLEATNLIYRLQRSGVQLLDPLPYRSMLETLARAAVIVTDSGGLQEEASWLGVPVVVLRRSTPRWEGVKAGAVALAGIEPEEVLSATLRMTTEDEQARIAALPCLYGSGGTGEAVADLLSDPSVVSLLDLREIGAIPAQVLA